MGAAEGRFESVLREFREEIDALQRLGINLIGSFPEGGPLRDRSLAAVNADALEGPGVELLVKVLRGGIARGLDAPCLVDLSKAAVAWEALGRPGEDADIREALLRGRVRLQGTDGVRGPVRLSSEGDAVLHFGRTGEITPEFVEVLSYAFARMVRRAGLVHKGASIITAGDGRDAATEWKLTEAMHAGFAAAGLEVIHLGVAPTPAVPFAQARRGIRLGAVLTASHNPASQNGVKFFIDGFKMLPEGPVGDYALSALAYEVSKKGIDAPAEGAVNEVPEILDEFADYIAANVPVEPEILRNIQIVFDPANGAFSEAGRRVFEKLGLDVTAVNDDPRGENINQGGGVAEIEGRVRIGGEEAAGSPALASVAAMMERAQASGSTVYGIVLDGDGDRGFVAACEPGSGEALVADGDSEAYILARHFRESGRIADGEAADYEFVGTVESDLQLFANVRRELGLSTRIECVGDKWLVQGRREGRRLAVGQEVSGHVLWPTETRAPDGSLREVLTGNGLLTALAALGAARALGLSPAEMAEPFAPGAFLTLYTYNVDKALFFRGSKAWQADVRAAAAVLERSRGKGFETWRFEERAQEPDMLYIRLDDESGERVGAVFVRNSGTENKTGIYARGGRCLEPVLREACQRIAKLHGRTLKDKTSAGYLIEMSILAVLEEGPLSREALLERLESMLDEPASETEIDSVLYGMRKEGLIEFENAMIAIAG